MIKSPRGSLPLKSTCFADHFGAKRSEFRRCFVCLAIAVATPATGRAITVGRVHLSSVGSPVVLGSVASCASARISTRQRLFKYSPEID